MPASIDKLLKILQLEGNQFFYSDRAIIGGLEKLLPTWFQEATTDHLSDEIKTQISDALGKYSSLSPVERHQKVTALALFLKNTYPDDLRIAKSEAIIAKTVAKDLPPVQPPTRREESRPSTSTPAAKPQTYSPPAQTMPTGPGLGLDAPITVINGVGKETAKKYQNIGVKTLGDLLYYFPRRYDDYSQLKTINRLQYGDELTIIATVQSASSVNIKNKNQSRIEVVVSDGTGFLRLVFFRFGQDVARYYENQFKHGVQLVISGKVEMYLGRLQMRNPEWELLDRIHLNTNGIIPVYPLTAGLTQNEVRKDIHQVINFYSNKVPDFMPVETKRAANLIDLPVALHQIHYPNNHDLLNSARERLAFDEFFMLQLGVLQQKKNWQSGDAAKYTVSDEVFDSLTSHLPYELTNAQKRALTDIRQDLNSGKPMNRLLQGDVGSGKTVVAALAASIIASAEAQSAIMAPTSILAEQHYQTLVKLTTAMGETSPIQPDAVKLLTGDTSKAERELINTGLQDGSIKLLIGTHALIEDPVQFKHLQFVVIDEQHRFGVAQRAALRQKGETPHLLVMTATPIPRSLALTLYGDLDLSVMDELPAGRQPVETHVLHPLERERAYEMIHAQVKKGFQAFIIYPLIEKTENSSEEVKAAVDEHDLLQKTIFPDLKLGLLHGRMKPDEKEAVMKQFREKEFHILISTTVVEVGVDVPNATIMLIEGANRFGLAQLHQLRGRVGRAGNQSYCLLIPDTEDALENERLVVMTETNDGFVLAEKDLQQRGPGDFIGSRQSGFAELRLASISDIKTIEKSRSLAASLFESDPDLSKPDHALLKNQLTEFWKSTSTDLS
ncbi:MAG: ATP-dependent DNA helicase RecG [Anaerolineaceae bacterium]|nr:ATP-dependent DNA helicase RecG [Anaerolineaceae bacterium]